MHWCISMYNFEPSLPTFMLIYNILPSNRPNNIIIIAIYYPISPQSFLYIQKYCLITLVYLGGTIQPRTWLIYEQHYNFLWITLDNNPIPFGFLHTYTWKVLQVIQYLHDPTLFSLCYKTITLTLVNLSKRVD